MPSGGRGPLRLVAQGPGAEMQQIRDRVVPRVSHYLRVEEYLLRQVSLEMVREMVSLGRVRFVEP